MFYGSVMEYQPGRELVDRRRMVATARQRPIGPMSLQVQCAMDGPACRLRVRQSGFEDTPRWLRYYGVIEVGWLKSMVAAKQYVDQPRHG